MLRTLKSDFEQTLPHFCSFLAFRALQKSSRNRLKNSIPVTSSKKWYKKRHFSDFRPSWLPNWLQHGSPKLAQNRPKTWQIVYKSLQAYKTLPKWLRSSKNIQKYAKIFKKATNMAASWDSNSNKIDAKSVSRDRFPGNSKKFQTCATIDYRNTTLVASWDRRSSIWEGQLSNFSSLSGM